MGAENQIEEILMEADAYGLRLEVIETAKKFMEEGIERVESYELAFQDWVK
jgi:hypothetical protein